MNKCPKCGTEFEGNFCPECGNSLNGEKLCPNCKKKVPSKAKFCPECGFTLLGATSPVYSSPIIASSLSASSISSPRPVAQKKENETAVMVARFLPLALLLLFSLALWAFYATPVLSLNVIIDKIESNLYQIYGDPLLEDLHPIIITIFIVTASVNLISVILLVAARNHKTNGFSFLALLIYLLYLILGIILIVLIKKSELDVGACPILLVVFSSILMIITIITLIMWAGHEPQRNDSVSSYSNCYAKRFDGTYYLYINENYDLSKFIIIRGTNWCDQNKCGGSVECYGNYVKLISGFSTGGKFLRGQIIDDVLKIDNDGKQIIYVKLGHQHSFLNGRCACGCRIELNSVDSKNNNIE